ncbi:MAG TPA: flagellar assembly protein FliW, partial [Epulopiscium sp.]|nr:flagellar assembly protein FliW [Candidatus Epulonipiscium sp.]
MKLNTKNFGELEILEDKIITFQYGIPGFTQYTQYIII